MSLLELILFVVEYLEWLQFYHQIIKLLFDYSAYLVPILHFYSQICVKEIDLEIFQSILSINLLLNVCFFFIFIEISIMISKLKKLAIEMV